MTTISERFYAAQGAIYEIPEALVASAALGYVYSRLADIPAVQAAKYWAIYGFATAALFKLSEILFENKKTIAFSKAIVVVTADSLFILEMRKQQLLGSKMMYAIIIFSTLLTLDFLKIAAGKASKPARGEIETG